MSIRVALSHVTEYRYDRPVTLLPHLVRLRPAPHCRTPILSYSLRIEPCEHFLNWQQDPYSNYLARAVFLRQARELRVVVDLVAEMTAHNPFDFFLEPSAESYPFAYEPGLARELIPYLQTEPATPRFQALLDQVRRPNPRVNDFLVDVNRHVQRAVRYLIRMEPGVQTCEETLTLGSGSCRDSAWLLVQLFRHLGLAARFVSGYLIQLAPDQKPLEGPAGPEHDFTDLHAWTEVYLPGAGWVGLDATSGLLAAEGHIPLACAAEPTNAAPISGGYEWTKDLARGEADRCAEEFTFRLGVARILETPRVTRPYTEEQWQAINEAGRHVDDDLRSHDVRLTLGGEPTFVSLDDREGEEWNTAALGPAKRRQAGELLRRLRDRFAPGGFLHFGQGKWYPGEPLPRWALGCYWRRDGIPIWQEPSLVAADDRQYGHDEAVARRFIEALAERLHLSPDYAVPAYEDAYYYLWRERRLPVNVNPVENRLDDPLERDRLARIIEQQTLGKIVGYALPLEGDPTIFPRWRSTRWPLRQSQLFLLPGDSPMGFRLPLDSLPWVPTEQRQQVIELDPFAPRGPLPIQHRIAQHLSPTDSSRPSADGIVGAPGQNGSLQHSSIHTALCVEPREGCLHVFMPPQRTVEDYLDLVAAVEATAVMLNVPVRIEGYPPPVDHRLLHFQLTPDPGVLEVNIHPAQGWDELVTITNQLYEEARQVRLGTEKFMLDGRHTGTGGGNHVVLGGPTPADSPILRRPDLLRSLLGYWHNHPSLSYLFSGLFIGPTSQAPRADEGRPEHVYELELAFRQVPDHGGCLPWLADRVFRHLLVDVTGNTHRAEFCIDKLYSPDAAGSRRGLLELRAFEMPPHARMSLVQMLLLRAFVARFWKAPYTQRLVRWGTELHDRFLLPHFIWQDFQDLLLETAQAGYPLDAEWFAAHFEFRFPLLGSVDREGIHLEVRQALEPWNVLGEEPSGGGPVRYVDTSLERLQVKTKGWIDPRHVITCNGRPLPLHPTGINGEYVAGVRFRAWQPPSCLHPTIPVHVPLVLDIHDTWTRRSVGGCTYHVSHPGGRAHEIFPVNAAEAEGRRTARFFPFGHTPGATWIPPAEFRPESPLTLDLRQFTAAEVPAPVVPPPIGRQPDRAPPVGAVSE